MMNVMDISNCRSCCRCRCRRCCCRRCCFCCRPSRKTNVYLLHIFLFIMIACCCCCRRVAVPQEVVNLTVRTTAHEKYSMTLDFHAIDVIDLNFIVNHNVLVVRFFSPKIAVRSENVARSTSRKLRSQSGWLMWRNSVLIVFIAR